MSPQTDTERDTRTIEQYRLDQEERRNNQRDMELVGRGEEAAERSINLFISMYNWQWIQQHFLGDSVCNLSLHTGTRSAGSRCGVSTVGGFLCNMQSLAAH